MELTGKTVLITGAAGGIGAATVQAFRDAGANLVLSDLTVDRLPTDEGILARACDVTDMSSVKAMVTAGKDRFGAIDGAINNAGIAGPRVPFADMDDALWHQLIAVNLTGMYHALPAEIAAMAPQGQGRIIKIASLAGVLGAPGLAAYGATKHAVVGLTKSLAHELGSDGIRVNALCPSYVDTPMLNDINGTDKGKLQSELNAVGRFGTAQEMADALLRLASDTNSFMNGQAVVLDGGISAI
jgi:NAD(P)-dependent dehydrogenase (short-subunit alcohol dehydrogenase family)